jgi:type IV secretion system protein VirB1
MPLTWVAVTALAAACSPAVAPSTLAAVAKVESGFDPLAIGVNGVRPRQVHPATLGEAVVMASRLLREGQNIDLGLAQINSGNLGRLGLSVERAFDACANLEASGRVLVTAYAGAPARGDGTGLALLQALSVYNTGHADRGFRNGYVAKVTAAAAILPNLPITAALPRPAPPAWDVFAQAERNASFVTTPATPGANP